MSSAFHGLMRRLGLTVLVVLLSATLIFAYRTFQQPLEGSLGAKQISGDESSGVLARSLSMMDVPSMILTIMFVVLVLFWIGPAVSAVKSVIASVHSRNS